MLNELLLGFGVHASAIPRIWEKIPEEAHKDIVDANAGKIPRLSPIHTILDLCKRQLLPGPKYDKFNNTLTEYINMSLCWNQTSAMYQRGTDNCIRRISLSRFCSEILVTAITKTLFGDGIYDIEPDMTKHLLDFNDDAWMIVFQYPQGSNSKLNRARGKMLRAFGRYLQSPNEARAGQSWLVQTVVRMLESVDIMDDDRAALMIMIYWASVSTHIFTVQNVCMMLIPNSERISTLID